MMAPSRTSIITAPPRLFTNRLSASGRALDEAGDGVITKALESGDLQPGNGATLLLRDIPSLRPERVLLVRVGTPERSPDREALRKAAAAGAAALARTRARDALDCLCELDIPGTELGWRARMVVEAYGDATYRFKGIPRKDEGEAPPPALRALFLRAADRAEARSLASPIAQGQAIVAGKTLARELGNLPANICTPRYLADRARALARGQPRLQARILDERQMRAEGMGALLGVAQGSRQPPRLVVLRYQGAGPRVRPVALVGKGVTFDSGGVSIKPSANMDEMKFDMCGAAAVMGTILAANELALPINVVGVIPATENLPDGNALKPGDVLKSLSGQTVEVLNTDAEGRLILCDALTYARRFDPELIVDAATLTGACVVALGHHPTGLFANDDGLAGALERAAQESGDRVWRMPLWDDYQEELRSRFADMANVGSRWGGAITAACFLARYTEGLPWAHLDIAGTAWETGQKKGATGRPVPLLVQLLIDHAGGETGAGAPPGGPRRGGRTRKPR